MATHRIHVLVELDVTDLDWELNYSNGDSPEQITEHVDSTVNAAVNEALERVGWGDMVRTTGTLVATTAEPLP